jgi:predicted nucleic acid-binding Zn ribbon protein
MTRLGVLVTRRFIFRGRQEVAELKPRRRARDPASAGHGAHLRRRLARMHRVQGPSSYWRHAQRRDRAHRGRADRHQGARAWLRGLPHGRLAARGLARPGASEHLEALPMSSPSDGPGVLPESERSAVVASPEPVCTVCGGPRGPRKRETCSDKCRAGLSRQRRKDAQRSRDDKIRTLLETALKKLDGGAP